MKKQCVRAAIATAVSVICGVLGTPANAEQYIELTTPASTMSKLEVKFASGNINGAAKCGDGRCTLVARQVIVGGVEDGRTDHSTMAGYVYYDGYEGELRDVLMMTGNAADGIMRLEFPYSGQLDFLNVKAEVKDGIVPWNINLYEYNSTNPVYYFTFACQKVSSIVGNDNVDRNCLFKTDKMTDWNISYDDVQQAVFTERRKITMTYPDKIEIEGIRQHKVIMGSMSRDGDVIVESQVTLNGGLIDWQIKDAASGTDTCKISSGACEWTLTPPLSEVRPGVIKGNAIITATVQ
ncbi:hypothetical protein DLR11_21225 [Salmonella enterica subsp. salamae]|uniref:Uncharacterized protein n=1 Tax=Salmonella enterica subsp. salamae TaxID=59202 RepID=A0A5Y3V2R0_SALER|nr:hypothetical protein [Salmonella enterica subsp. salamae]ECI3454287.1 hypothetical protein [Salmonella enterica subsp. salamae]ECJ2327125.1 hypothetical protein [Salmonella enterica subsp. salamae]EEO8344818.1 hypothetical protein [Salmonella enterica]